MIADGAHPKQHAATPFVRRDAFGHFDVQYASLLSGMSVIVGVLDKQDAVIASDGCAGDPCHSKYVLKTARIGRRLCIGMTGDTDHMRELFVAIDMAIPNEVADEEIFWYLEEATEAPEAEFLEVWERLGCAFDEIRTRLRESKYAVTTVIVGEHEGTVAYSLWAGENDWEQKQWSHLDGTAAFNLGRPARDEDEDSALYAAIDSRRGTTGAASRLVEAVRYWSECDCQRTVNRNAFVRRLSNDFALCHSLDPCVEHCDRIKKRLASVGAVKIKI